MSQGIDLVLSKPKDISSDPWNLLNSREWRCTLIMLVLELTNLKHVCSL